MTWLPDREVAALGFAVVDEDELDVEVDVDVEVEDGEPEVVDGTGAVPLGDMTLSRT
jgi:hypothetical protein